MSIETQELIRITREQLAKTRAILAAYREENRLKELEVRAVYPPFCSQEEKK